MAKLAKPIEAFSSSCGLTESNEPPEVFALRADLERAMLREVALKQKIADMAALSEIEIMRISEHTERLVKRLSAAEAALSHRAQDVPSSPVVTINAPSSSMGLRAWARRIFVRRPRRMLVRLGLIRS